jgi:hypothetical protein
MTARAIRRDLPTRPSSLFSGNRLAVVLLGRRDALVLFRFGVAVFYSVPKPLCGRQKKRRDPWAAGSRELAGPSEDEVMEFDTGPPGLKARVTDLVTDWWSPITASKIISGPALRSAGIRWRDGHPARRGLPYGTAMAHAFPMNPAAD